VPCVCVPRWGMGHLEEGLGVGLIDAVVGSSLGPDQWRAGLALAARGRVEARSGG
jgi:hypothetical protein